MNTLEAREQFNKWMTAKYYSHRTIESYITSVERFFKYLGNHKTVVSLAHSKRVEEYLSWRVTEGDVSPSTQSVELNALVQFHRMLGIELTGINALRAKRRDRIPPILSQQQVATLIDNSPHDMRLILMILYGCALRINECLRLRIKDVDLSLEKFLIHEAKGDKDRIIPIPKTLLPLIRIQRDKAIAQWKIDVYHKFNGVNCGGVEKKYPSQKADTHMAQDMINKGFPEKMIKAQLKELSGHVMDETLEGYLHLAAPKNSFVVSPIDTLVYTNYSDTVG